MDEALEALGHQGAHRPALLGGDDAGFTEQIGVES
jgi:hypothetical protein